MSAKDPSFVHLNFSYLRQVTQGDPDQERQILQMVAEELAEAPPLLQQHSALRQWPQLAWQAHHFKNTLFFVGDQALEALNNQLLQAARLAGEAGNALPNEAYIQALAAQIADHSQQTRLVLLQRLTQGL